jgi:hypothetical protein
MPGQKQLTPNEAKFAASYLETGNASLAYRLHYKTDTMAETTVNREAHTVLHRPKVQAEIKRLQAAVHKKTTTTIADLVAEQDQAMQLALETRNATAFASASMNKAKLLGLLVEKQEVRTGHLDPIEAAPDISQVWASSVAPKTDEHETKH